MAGIGGFRGVSASQDARFVNKQKRMLRTKKFPKELDVSVDYDRVSWPVIREWTAKRVTELLGVEDDVLIQFIHNRLENTKELNPKELYLDLMPFLEKNAGLFMKELWTLLASAAESPSGIPQQILDAKAEELRQHKARQELYLQTIEMERQKVIAIQEEAKQAAMQTTKEEINIIGEKTKLVEHPKESEHHSNVEEDSSRRHQRHVSPLRKREETYRHRRHRSRSPKKARSPYDRHHRRMKELDYKKRPRIDKRFTRPPPRNRSFSRSPPVSRHGSPPPRSSRLPLARKREPHDMKSRSPARHHQPREGLNERSPTTKSPSPRSRNRMSTTPYEREKTPSPPSDKISKTPTPKPSTPKTFTPPTRLEEDPPRRVEDQVHSSLKASGDESTRGPLKKSHGVHLARSHRLESPKSPMSYRYQTPQVRRGYEERSQRKEYSSSRYSYRRSHRHRETERRDYDHSRKGYAYRPASPLRVHSLPTREEHMKERRSYSSSSFDEEDKAKSGSSSESQDSRKAVSRRNSGKKDKGRSDRRKRKLDQKKMKKSHFDDAPKEVHGDQGLPQNTEHSLDDKEKMKRKLDEILEKKDSLHLD